MASTKPHPRSHVMACTKPSLHGLMACTKPSFARLDGFHKALVPDASYNALNGLHQAPTMPLVRLLLLRLGEAPMMTPWAPAWSSDWGPTRSFVWGCVGYNIDHHHVAIVVLVVAIVVAIVLVGGRQPPSLWSSSSPPCLSSP